MKTSYNERKEYAEKNNQKLVDNGELLQFNCLECGNSVVRDMGINYLYENKFTHGLAIKMLSMCNDCLNELIDATVKA